MATFDTEARYRGNRQLHPVPKHLLIEPYCILCRITLLSDERFISDPSHIPGALEPWKIETFCFFDIPGSKNAPSCRRVHMFRARLTDPEWINGNEATQNILREAETKLCYFYSCSSCDPDVTANLVHVSCFQLLKKKLKIKQIQNPAEILCRVAKMTRPLMDWRRAVRIMDVETRPPQFLLPEPSYKTDLGCLVSDFRLRLPLELQKLILDHLPSHSFFYSLNACLMMLQTTSMPHIVGSTFSNTEFETNPQSHLQTPPGKLFASTISILGEECFTMIGPHVESDLWVLIEDIPIQELQYALGLYGIVALRLIYEDGSCSSWLGQTKRRWVATFRGTDLNRLNILTDGFKLISMGLGEDRMNKTKLLRNTDIPLPKHSRSFLIDTSITRVGIRGNATQRLVTCLPLKLDDGCINSLTMFCDVDSVCGIQLNGQADYMLGSTKNNCCTITYYLQPGELIKSLHLITRGERDPFLFQGPYIIATTSTSRTLFYAPQVLLQVPERHFSNFTDDTSYFVSGIFNDPTTARKVGERTLGVVLQPLPSDSGAHKRPCFGTFSLVGPHTTPSFMLIHAGIAFLTRANLARTKCLKVQKIHGRCIGLLIQRTDDSIDILGQWDLAQTNGISTLYNGTTDSSLESITFVCSTANPTRRFVQSIHINKSDTGNQEFKWERLDKALAWWFTFQYDFLEYWAGTEATVEMLESNIPPLEVE